MTAQRKSLPVTGALRHSAGLDSCIKTLVSYFAASPWLSIFRILERVVAFGALMS